jgi:DNA-binding phage protein
MENIGREIKKLIEKKRVSIYRIAEALGVAPESLYRSLDDGANPEWKRIKALLDYLGYDVKFVKRKEVKKTKPKPSKTRKKR